MNVTEYRSIDLWRPQIGDFIVCSKTFSSWYGVVLNVDNVNEMIEIVFAASPRVLFSLSPLEIKKRKKVVDMDEVRSSNKYSVQQVFGGQSAWYLK